MEEKAKGEEGDGGRNKVTRRKAQIELERFFSLADDAAEDEVMASEREVGAGAMQVQ